MACKPIACTAPTLRPQLDVPACLVAPHLKSFSQQEACTLLNVQYCWQIADHLHCKRGGSTGPVQSSLQAAPNAAWLSQQRSGLHAEVPFHYAGPASRGDLLPCLLSCVAPAQASTPGMTDVDASHLALHTGLAEI